MGDLRLKTLDGADALLSEGVAEELGRNLRGSLLGPRDNGYEEARKVWNGMTDKRPGVVARCASAADVIQAVNFARDHQILLAVRGGDHSVAGHSVCEGGLRIDLSCMKAVRIDPAQRTARAEAGARWRDFDHETQAFGLSGASGK